MPYLSQSHRYFIHPLLALISIGLASCGGGGGGGSNNATPDSTELTYSIDGTVTGLTGTVVLLNNLSDSQTISIDGSVEFIQLPSDSSYSITIKAMPSGQVCSVNNGSGQVGTTGITDITVDCATTVTNSDFAIGGTVDGLNGTLVLQNNEGDTTAVSGNSAYPLAASSISAYTFSTRMINQALYNVTIAEHPEGQLCSVANSSGLVDGSDISDTIIICTADDTTISLSGTISAVPLTHIDSDINDPLATTNVNNNDFPVAQLIPSFSTVQGFATKAGTGRIQDADRFATTSDEFDIYRVLLQKDQLIQLQVVDFDGADIFTGDLDLYLYDIDENLVGGSKLVTEFESIRVPSDGEYYIKVLAFSGTSKYSLSLTGIQPLGMPGGQESMDFRVDEAVVQFKPIAFAQGIQAASLSVSVNHTDTSRATLAHFDTMLNISSSLTPSSALSPALQTLATNNPESYQKFQTLQQIKQLSLRDDVEFAEPNYIYQALKVPNDQYYGYQWHYPAIKLPQAWDITTGSRDDGEPNVIVAVVDTGVYLTHPELENQLVDGYDFISDPQNALDGNGIDSNPDDPGDSSQLGSSSWHGTHVSGTVAAESNNSVGIAGVAWGAKVMPLRVLGAYGGSGYDINQALLFAAGLANDSGTVPAQKADVINLSLGGSGYSQAAQNTYNLVRSTGVLVVAAAGNANNSVLHYPASYDGVISVSATDFANNRAPYSSYGSRVDVAAPGGSTGVDLNGDGSGDGVLSTLVNDSSGTRVASFSFYQGTSMATPHMAGVLALMRAVYPSLTPNDIDGLLASGVITTDLGAIGRDDYFGHGLIDALKAVQAAETLANSGVPPTPPAIIEVTPSQITFGLASDATVTVTNSGGGTPSVTGTVSDSSWLSVTASAVDAEGLGEYAITIDRSGLSSSSSTYQGSITFSLSTGSTVVVQVSMIIGIVDNTGSVGSLYILLLDSEYNILDQAIPVPQGNGIFDYQFDNVPPGEYRIIGGSDIDNDIFICQMAEMCGGYPTADSMTPVNTINVNITDLDFVVDILANFGIGTLSVAEGTHGSTGIMRLPVKSKQITK
ncbi:MAG: S8 family serine peptidase [Candidatus Polarisedimenticolaceae bacterium]|nr:S8 family serine peptidase [Candidatus Polarisedimenticolaceae bacterium]